MARQVQDGVLFVDGRPLREVPRPRSPATTTATPQGFHKCGLCPRLLEAHLIEHYGEDTRNPLIAYCLEDRRQQSSVTDQKVLRAVMEGRP